MSRPTPQTCQFVLASDLFKGHDDLYDEFTESSSFTWGDTNRTLVDFRSILQDLDNHGIEYPDEFVNLVPLNMYVDLEN
jgi:hypothetical protein